MDNCTKCGSNKLDLIDDQVWAGVRFQRFKCQNCGQIQAGEMLGSMKKRGRPRPGVQLDADDQHSSLLSGNPDLDEVSGGRP